jgi:endonuclease/exonuclease/phosphatase family metal-dependent hydrolase
MRKIIKSAFVFITILTALVYLPSCFVYLISPAAWWPMGILGIGFPYIWFFMVALFVVWLLAHKKTAAFIFILLLAGWPVMKNVVALRKPVDFSVQKAPACLRVLQWNCQGFPGSFFGYPELVVERSKTVAFLKKYQPDVLCLSEFTNVTSEHAWSTISLLRDTLGYRYLVFHPTFTDGDGSWATVHTGNAIFSKYPIVDSGYFAYKGKIMPEDIIKATINFNGKNIRVLNTHLASMHLNHIRIPGPLASYFVQDSAIIFHGSTMDKLKYFQRYHVSQAALVKTMADTCSVPLIVCGDFNSVPSSYVYKQLKGKLSDAFLEKGSGLGRSFHSRQPALRIDYLFHSNDIKVLQWDIFRVSFADHDPEIMDVIIH